MANHRIYDWDNWFAAGKFKIVRGTHYHVTTQMMYQILRNRASDYNYDLTTVKTENSIEAIVSPRKKRRTSAKIKSRR